MQIRWFISIFMAAACAATPVLAQNPSSGRSRETGEKVTLTGCIERADQVLSRDTLGRSVDSQMFVLVIAPAESAQSARPAAGQQENPPRIYRLTDEAKTLNPHVGHRVEIVGTLAGPATSAQAVGTSGDHAAAAGVPVAEVKVDSLKMISQACSR
jgi:hypothetical protein